MSARRCDSIAFFVRFAFYTRALGFLIVSVCVDSMSWLELGSGKVEYTHL